ncbi:heavy-metal-associated domain-containing protein [Urechidicola croceus]|uniref:HMA domain-containing protein n=1 Tax=Urechidicola croceus TaxID=1850246 RepID=A0A1D8P8H0_9FLAO|nr:heavy-metal-associated domain-containing protein [Urechidicola croceus]AOW20865.1 hypothetical protein LPB138_09355 [Urechidicola croceus]
MKAMKYFVALTLLLVLFACKNETKVVSENSNETETRIAKKENLQNMEVSIEGMTCAIGCAKLIESKVHKLEGVTFSKVNFENKLGQFTFDSNIISAEEIEKNINGVAGGELYKVSSNNIVKEFHKLVEVK